jgi:zinc transporter, ZIP family
LALTRYEGAEAIHSFLLFTSYIPSHVCFPRSFWKFSLYSILLPHKQQLYISLQPHVQGPSKTYPIPHAAAGIRAAKMAIDNDTRGWIMTCISGVACIVGASIVCVDVFVRHIPGMERFSIAESDSFLSASLSLSFGVMLFSALFSMLPQSQHYLEDGRYSPQAAAFLLIALFLAGVVGIRILSTILHQYIPSHVVDCDHTHDEEDSLAGREEMEEHAHDDEHTNGMPIVKFATTSAEDPEEETPLLSRTTSISLPKPRQASAAADSQITAGSENGFVTAPQSRRPSAMPRSLTKTFAKLTASRKYCDETGPCMGYSDPCGQECFKAVSRRTSSAPFGRLSRTPTFRGFPELHFASPLPQVEERPSSERTQSDNRDGRSRAQTNGSAFKPLAVRSRSATHHYHHPEHDHEDPIKMDRGPSVQSHSVGPEHHHHVPTNAFLSIGLQTSIAIALHKAPEGFITYATNHANPQLGFAVFMALFIHNITEGFAMSLPLYLALGSRFKAIAWSSILGGLSQPLGAGIAALWFKVAKNNGSGSPSEGVYGGMFAVTAGVMTSVALSLFSESLTMSHNKNACIAWAFTGMAILGVSFAMTAGGHGH